MRALAALPLAALLSLGACANSPQMRTVAGHTATTIAAHRRTTADFVARQAQTNAYDANRQLDTTEETVALVDRTRAITNGWAPDDPRQAALSRLTTVSAEDILAARDTVAPRPAGLSDGGAALEKAEGAFADLAKTPTTFQRFKAALEIGQGLYTAYEGLKTKASDDAAK